MKITSRNKQKLPVDVIAITINDMMGKPGTSERAYMEMMIKNTIKTAVKRDENGLRLDTKDGNSN